MGKNIKGNNVFVFFQLCSLCYEPVIGFKEGNKDKQWLLNLSYQLMLMVNEQCTALVSNTPLCVFNSYRVSIKSTLSKGKLS
jgi:hypothetical protein